MLVDTEVSFFKVKSYSYMFTFRVRCNLPILSHEKVRQLV